jgi:hypothetical protein
MNIKIDEIHDSLVATYQSIEASILNQVLARSGITDSVKRGEIISSFLFEQGVVLDQFWFKDNDVRWYPGVYFSTVPHDQLAQGDVYLPSDQYGMNFHEYAHGATEWALENENDPAAIEIGND